MKGVKYLNNKLLNIEEITTILDRDFIPLESEGYFGIPCRNLLQGGESGGYAWQDEYELDPSQMVKSVREKVTSPDGNSMSLYEFKIRWK